MFGRRGMRASHFGDGEPQSVGIIFGLMSLAFLLAAGAAVDYARVADMREGLEAATNSASDAAGQAIRDGKLSDDEVAAIATSHFDKTVASARHVGTIETPIVKVDYTTRTITVGARGIVAMTVSRLGGISEVTVPAIATVGFPPGTPAPRASRSVRSLAYSGGW